MSVRTRRTRLAGGGAAGDAFQAVADPTRRRLLEMLLESEHTAGSLARPFRVSRPAISQHLGILRHARLVHVRREGRERYYRVNPKPLGEIRKWTARFVRFMDPAGHAWALRQAGPPGADAGPRARRSKQDRSPPRG